MKIQIPEVKNSKEISSLLRETFREVNCKDYSPTHINAWIRLDCPEEIRRRLRNGNLRNFIATEDGEIVGFLSISIRESLLNSLYVKSSKIGHGIGSELLEFAEMLFKSHGKEIIQVNSSKTAIDFYKKKGYEKKEEINILVEGIKIPVTQMTKKLE